jgi:serine/threonine-protein kinase
VKAGAILADKYRLISPIGQGGMGAVWRAERLGWQSEVAVKVMNPAMLSDARSVARFQGEAGSIASLRSLHVVQVLDDGVDEATGAPFIVMELLEGETLADRLARVTRLYPTKVARIVSQVAMALGRAHAAGVVHRDLKPDNIFLARADDDEIVKVLDFGIAKSAVEPPKENRTLTGHLLGTLSYMSPEQIKNARAIDHRADLWSLGVIACEAMTGARPFHGDNFVSLALTICSGEVPTPSRLGTCPRGFDAWFARSVALDPEQRFESARSMADELGRLCEGAPRRTSTVVIPTPASQVGREPTEQDVVLELRRPSKRGPARSLLDSMPPVLAAAYAFGIAKNHPFVDGNKRTAFVACELFLAANGHELAASDEECLAMMLGLAASEVSEAEFAAWLRENVQPA